MGPRSARHPRRTATACRILLCATTAAVQARTSLPADSGLAALAADDTALLSCQRTASSTLGPRTLACARTSTTSHTWHAGTAAAPGTCASAGTAAAGSIIGHARHATATDATTGSTASTRTNAAGTYTATGATAESAGTPLTSTTPDTPLIGQSPGGMGTGQTSLLKARLRLPNPASATVADAGWYRRPRSGGRVCGQDR